jgi:nitrite reductase/ring-hydroxylating ferredoxin subunit
MPEKVIAQIKKADLESHPTAKFSWQDALGRPREGLVVKWQGVYHAYENACPHVGTPLDWDANQFFEEDGRYLICSTHGAIFAPDTGLCLGGPCKDDHLPWLDCREEDDVLIISLANRKIPQADG